MIIKVLVLPETKYWRAALAQFDIYLLVRLICCNFSKHKRTMRLRAMPGLSVEIKSDEKLPVITAFLSLCLQIRAFLQDCWLLLVAYFSHQDCLQCNVKPQLRRTLLSDQNNTPLLISSIVILCWWRVLLLTSIVNAV